MTESSYTDEPEFAISSKEFGTLQIYLIRCRLTSMYEDPVQRKMWVNVRISYRHPDGWLYLYGFEEGGSDKWILWDGKSQPFFTWGKRFGSPFTGVGRIAAIIHDIECAKADKLAADGFTLKAIAARKRADEMYYLICLLLGKKPRAAKWMWRGIRAAARHASRQWLRK